MLELRLRLCFKCPECGGKLQERLGKDKYTTRVECGCGFEVELTWKEPQLVRPPSRVFYGSWE